MKPRRIELRLQELVLEGVDARERDRVVAALEQELGRQLRGGRLPRTSVDELVAEGPKEPGAERLGARVGEVIAKGDGR